MLKIVAGGLDDPQVIRLLGIHLTEFARANPRPAALDAPHLAGLEITPNLPLVRVGRR